MHLILTYFHFFLKHTRLLLLNLICVLASALTTSAQSSILEDFSGYAGSDALNASISNATANATVTLVGGAMVLEGKNGADPFFTQVTLDVTDTSLDGIDSFTAEVSYVSGSRENLKIELLDAGGSVLATLNPVLALQNFSGTVMIDVSSITGTLSSVRFTYEAVDFGTISASFDDLKLEPTELSSGDTPTNLTALEVTEESFILSWSAVANATGGYNVFIEGTSNSDILVGVVNETSIVFEGTYGEGDNAITISNGGEYIIKVQSILGNGLSGFARIEVEIDFTEQTKLTNLQLVDVSETSFTLAWDPISGAIRINVFIQSSDQNAEAILAATITADATSYKFEGTYDDLTIEAGTTYIAEIQPLPDSDNDALSQLTVKTDQVVLNVDKTLVNMEFYPNPVSDSFTFKTELNEEIEFLVILSASGKELKRLIPSKTIDVSYLSSGMYYIKFYGTKGLIGTRKLIKK